ncbi:MAG: hypothetical protein ACOH2M_03305 [Cypionkella sp.]
MTTRKPPPPAKIAEARATIPTRPVIAHTKLFRAEMQVQHQALNNALANVDHALTAAAGERDAAVELANMRFAVIRAELDAERGDVLRNLDGVEAALDATEAKTNVEPIRQPIEVAA